MLENIQLLPIDAHPPFEVLILDFHQNTIVPLKNYFVRHRYSYCFPLLWIVCKQLRGVSTCIESAMFSLCHTHNAHRCPRL
jgi:hypothetical protein